MQPKPAQTGGRRRDIRSRFGVPAIIVMSLMIGTCSRMPGTYEQIRLLGALKVATSGAAALEDVLRNRAHIAAAGIVVSEEFR